MVNIPEIGQHTRNIVYILEIWSKYQKHGQHINIPEIWSTYQKYGQCTRNMVDVPEIWSMYQKYGQHTANEKGKVKIS